MIYRHLRYDLHYSKIVLLFFNKRYLENQGLSWMKINNYNQQKVLFHYYS